jgi:hypothetical protein
MAYVLHPPRRNGTHPLHYTGVLNYIVIGTAFLYNDKFVVVVRPKPVCKEILRDLDIFLVITSVTLK